MPSIPQASMPGGPAVLPIGFPSTVVLGATGRLGRMVRACWQNFNHHAPITWLGGPQSAGGCDPLAQPEAFREILRRSRPKVIVSFAGRVPEPVSTPEEAASLLAEHSALARAICRAAHDAEGTHPVYVFLASSAAVYGAAEHSESGLAENTRLPINLPPYGEAKRAMEEAALVMRQAGAMVSVLRIGNVAGADAILGGWRPGFALDTLADGTTPTRSYLSGLDLADVLALLVCRAAYAPGSLPFALNVALPGAVAMGALLDAADMAWTPRPAREGQQRPIARVILDVRRLEMSLQTLPDGFGKSEELFQRRSPRALASHIVARYRLGAQLYDGMDYREDWQ